MASNKSHPGCDFENAVAKATHIIQSIKVIPESKNISFIAYGLVASEYWLNSPKSKQATHQQ